MKKKIDISKTKLQVPKQGDGQFIIVIGNPGGGKSTFASTFPKPLLLDFEGTASNIPNVKRERIIEDVGLEGIRTQKELEELGDTRDLPVKDLSVIKDQFLENDDFQTLILDGGLELMGVMQSYILKLLGRKRMSDHNYGDTYIEARELIERKFFKKIIGRGKNIVLICHIEENIRVDKETDEEYTEERPLIGDKKMVYKLPALANIVGKIEIDKKGERYFNCVPNKRSVFKNQFGITEPIKADYKYLKEKIKKYFEKGGK